MIRRLRARWRCHRTLWCCQHTDAPFCNSWDDPHLLARARFRRRIDRERNARGRR